MTLQKEMIRDNRTVRSRSLAPPTPIAQMLSSPPFGARAWTDHADPAAGGVQTRSPGVILRCGFAAGKDLV